MAKKPALGYPTQTALRAAIKAIVDPYPTGVEFFHPLLRRLFVERPYHGDPPGPTYTKFKYTKRTQPNGIVFDRWFMTFNDELGWCSQSWNKCVGGRKFDVVSEFKAFARWRVIEIVARYQMNNPDCEWRADNNHYGQIEVHHHIPMRIIVDEALVLMRKEELAISKVIQTWTTSDNFEILDHFESVKHILARHAHPGCLMTLCKNHHYAIEGKTHSMGIQQ
jgi:hypothetical protein